MPRKATRSKDAAARKLRKATGATSTNLKRRPVRQAVNRRVVSLRVTPEEDRFLKKRVMTGAALTAAEHRKLQKMLEGKPKAKPITKPLIVRSGDVKAKAKAKAKKKR